MEITVYGPLRAAADDKALTVATGSSTDGTDENAANSNTIVNTSEESGSIDASSVSADSPEIVSELITMIVEAYPQTKSHLFDCEGTLRPSVRILVDGNNASLETQLDPSSDIQLLPAMRGGSGHTVTRCD